MKTLLKKTVAALSLLVCANFSNANNIAVNNAKLINQTGTTRDVRFDVSWDNSWRTSSNQLNWDAAWVFVKYRKNGGNSWLHATLATTGNTPASGSTIDVPTDGKGAFVYRSADGSGSNAFNSGRVVWNSVADGVLSTDSVNICVFAVEMVYVPSGQYFLGTTGTETGKFYTAPTATTNYLVTSEAAITVGTTAGNLQYSGSYGDVAGPIPANYPKGFNAYYCMKYEISQGQYTDFLNYIPSLQATNRYPNTSANRHTISLNTGVYSCTAPNRACNYLCYNDVASYLDWSGLRLMTELEYEKACRGANQATVANEYAWGTSSYIWAGTTVSNDATANEVSSATNPNGIFYNGGAGSVLYRVGSCATSTSDRTVSGATYYGILDMTGNVFESVIGVGRTQFRSYTGLHGDGNLDGNGLFNVSAWPTGGAVKGTGYNDWYYKGYVSSREEANNFDATTRNASYGGRGVRTAP
jgi:formylglycine-generating enzyme required for sulfatase activity